MFSGTGGGTRQAQVSGEYLCGGSMTADAAAGTSMARAVSVLPGWGLALRVLPLAVIQNYAVGWALHYLHEPKINRAAEILAAPAVTMQGMSAMQGMPGMHGGHGRTMPATGWEQFVHFLRDSTLALPFGVAVLLLATICVRMLLRMRGIDADTVRARLAFAFAGGLAAGIAAIPSVMVHRWLFDEPLVGVSLGQHLVEVAVITLRYTFALALGYALVFGVPWQRFDRPAQAARQAGT
jgi:hypothetical protein